jgi:cytochrome P450
MVEEVTIPLVERFVESGGGDAMEAIARPVPIGVMGRWLGIDLPHQITTWADASFRLGAPDPPREATSNMAALIQWAFADGNMLRGKVRPGGLAEEILDGGMGEGLREEEVPVALISILIAGLDTTVHLIGNGLHALASHPDQYEQLLGDPDGQVESTVEETLRFESPVRFFLRRSDDGRTVALLFGAANRDERVFQNPASFLIERDASNHLAFGFGAHRCIGEPLAKLEASLVFRSIAERVRSLRLAEGVKRTDSRAIRGFSTLPLATT